MRIVLMARLLGPVALLAALGAPLPGRTLASVGMLALHVGVEPQSLVLDVGKRRAYVVNTASDSVGGGR